MWKKIGCIAEENVIHLISRETDTVCSSSTQNAFLPIYILPASFPCKKLNYNEALNTGKYYINVSYHIHL
jgi:hypothetical protein